MGIFDRLKKSLSKTRDKVVGGIRSVLPFGKPIDEQIIQDLQDTMIAGDMGPNMVKFSII